MNQEKLKELEPLFYPRSIAIIGATQNEQKLGYHWVKSLVRAGFNGNIYPVNPYEEEVLGLKIYPSITAIPGSVDYVIVSIPRELVPQVVEDCAVKGVKAVTIFAAGFKEAGDTLGRKLEAEIVAKVRQGSPRIIGPNCLGVYSPESKIGLGPEGMLGEAGSVGFISQSGGLADKLVSVGIARGINYSKGISFGNGCDLDSVDFLEYLAADPKTTVIGAYLEGTKNGRRLFDTMQRVAEAKPLIIWKGGRTKAGAEAAASHTGSLASPPAIWSTALKQAGAIEAHSLEELTDTLLLFQQLCRWQGNNVAIISGIYGAGGGVSVSATDICTEAGLSVPPLSQYTKQELTKLLGQTSAILHNPLDITPSLGKVSILKRVIGLAASDPAIDLVLVQEDVDILLSYLTLERLMEINNVFINFEGRRDKPIVFVLAPGGAEMERLEVERALRQAGIPVFPSAGRAAKAIVNMKQYFHFHSA